MATRSSEAWRSGGGARLPGVAVRLCGCEGGSTSPRDLRSLSDRLGGARPSAGVGPGSRDAHRPLAGPGTPARSLRARAAARRRARFLGARQQWALGATARSDRHDRRTAVTAADGRKGGAYRGKRSAGDAFGDGAGNRVRATGRGSRRRRQRGTERGDLPLRARRPPARTGRHLPARLGMRSIRPATDRGSTISSTTARPSSTPRTRCGPRATRSRLLPDAIAGIRAALADVQLAPGRLVVAGHSAGAALAADYAAVAGQSGLPEPAAASASIRVASSAICRCRSRPSTCR